MALPARRSTLLELGEPNLDDLPSEILVDIFLKLPVKCLLRMQCTCKLSYAVITHPKFTQLQFENAIKNPSYLYMLHAYSPPYIYFAEILSHCTDQAMKIPLWKNIYTHKTTTSGGLLATIVDAHKCCYIGNPILGEEIKVPLGLYSGDKFRMFWWGFGYSFSTKEYKIILFANPWSMELAKYDKDVVLGAIYTMGSDSWTEIPQVPFRPNSATHVDCDGTFFWLIYYDGDHQFVPRTNTIASFDVGSEQFRFWQGPNTYLNQDSCSGSYLIRVGGMVGCLKEMNDSRLSIWTLRDKVNEVWNKEYTIALTPPPQPWFWSL